MKVLHVTNAYPYPGNPIYGIFIKEQIDSLHGTTATNVVRFINGQKYGKFEYIRALPGIISDAGNYDIIHCHHLLSALPLLLLKSYLKAKVIVSLMSDGKNEILLPNNFATRRFSSWAYRMVLSRSDSRIFKKRIPEELSADRNSHYLPNGVNLSLFEPISQSLAKEKLQLDPSKRYVLFVSSGGLHRPEKRYDKFRAVMKILKVEKGLNNIEELLLTSIPRELVNYYFNAASLHLLTSDFEGSPNSVKEALACNVPVVSTDVGNVRDIMQDTHPCGVSQSGSPSELASLAHQALTAERPANLREQLIVNKFDSQSTASKLLQIYESITQ